MGRPALRLQAGGQLHGSLLFGKVVIARKDVGSQFLVRTGLAEFHRERSRRQVAGAHQRTRRETADELAPVHQTPNQSRNPWNTAGSFTGPVTLSSGKSDGAMASISSIPSPMKRYAVLFRYSAYFSNSCQMY
jgi:hypothetical protein